MISQNINHITISTVHEDLYCEKVCGLKSRIFFKRKPVIQKKDHGFFVDIGNPHFVYFLNTLTHETHKQNQTFHETYLCNIEAVKIIDKQNIEILIFERGAGPTPSCGTGSCAAALCCVLENFTNNTVFVHQEGGVLTIHVEKDCFSMEGEVRFLFTGFYEG
jgi:diaminopimelate epimerase